MRILHTMLRVGDLDRSLAFYTDVLGMQLLRRKDYPEGRFTLAFVGYGSEDRFADGMAQIASRFPPATCRARPGDHDWPVWRALWADFLDQGHFPESSCDAVDRATGQNKH